MGYTRKGNKTMNVQDWKQKIGEMVRANMRTPEADRYYNIKVTIPRAQMLLKQLALFVRHRRDCWAYASGNCPELAVKKKVLEHEFGEVIRDEYSEFGHLDLVIRQARAIGLTADDIMNAEPVPTTRATLYAWGWMTREKSWLEGIAALTVTEWQNDDRLLGDLGGGHSSRLAKRWMEDLGLDWERMPNFNVHRQADEDHSEMFLPFLSKFAIGEKEQLVTQAVQESLDLVTIYRGGVAEAMEKLPT
jgi:pyrroloquinoline quinone (PQQ) biosynthesis protein C